METVQVQCGHCGKLMAVSTEHLGARVHCPHCQQIVEAPAASPAAPGEPAPDFCPKGPDPLERDSIFGGSEELHGDDLFGGGPERPLVEMPPEPKAAPPPPAVPPPPSPTPAELPNRFLDDSPAIQDSFRQRPEEDSEPAPDADLPKPEVARRHSGGSMLVPMLLIFLIPYSIFSTAYIVWTLLHPPRGAFDPLERLPDPDPKSGGPRKVHPVKTLLPDKLKTSLNQAIRVGDLEVTPLKVRLSPEGDLVLHMKMHNLSEDLAFNPMPDSFLRTSRKSMVAQDPYTFLDAGTEKLFGGYPEWYRTPGGKKFDGILGPGEEMVAHLITLDKYRAQVRALLQAGPSFVWRVQVRRGFVRVKDADVSATAVIGIGFPARAVERPTEG
jgi:hypothetical protein